MIFITVGTQKFQMDRLLREIDTLITENKISDDVFAQIGYSSYQPQNFKYTKFLDDMVFQEYINKCDLLITHAGVGNIISGLRLHKKIIVFPRLREFGEHVDDHQKEISDHFHQEGYVLLCTSAEDLYLKIKQSAEVTLRKYQKSNDTFVLKLIKYMHEWGVQ